MDLGQSLAPNQIVLTFASCCTHLCIIFSAVDEHDGKNAL